jgi:hypothetical protein
MVQDTVQWKDVVKPVMNLRVSSKSGEFLEWLSDYQLLKTILLHGVRRILRRWLWPVVRNYSAIRLRDIKRTETTEGFCGSQELKHLN